MCRPFSYDDLMLKLDDEEEMQRNAGVFYIGVLVVEVQSRLGLFPVQSTNVTCVIGHSDTDLYVRRFVRNVN